MARGIPYIDTVTGELKYQGTSGTPAIIAGTDGTVHLIPIVFPYTGSTGIQQVGTSTFTSFGTIVINPANLFSGNSKITRTISFQIIAETTPNVTMEARLYNVSVGSVVTGSELSTSSNVPVVLTGTLTIGAAPNMPNSQQIYDVQTRISVPGVPGAEDRAICKSAQILVSWS